MSITKSILGSLKTTNLQVTSGATNGYVLTSDSLGNGTWTSPTSSALTKSHGSFISTVDQVASVAGTTYKMSADTSIISLGVTLSGGSKFVISNNGVYNIQFSAQLAKTSGTKSSGYIWLSKNGVPIPDSNTEILMDGGLGDRFVAAWNWFEQVTSPNSYFEIEWTDSVGNTILDYDASPPYGPAIPSLIVTISQL